MLSCVSTRLKSLLIQRSRNAIRNITTAEEESQFSDEELEKYKQLFVKFDLDRNCKLDRWEFNKFAGRLIGRSYYSTDLYKVFCKVDKNKDEFVSWPELHEHLHRRFSEQSKNKLIAAFNLFDKDNDGLLHWWETKQALFYLGENILDKNMRYNFDLFDHDQDERLSFPQFLKFICDHLKRQH